MSDYINATYIRDFKGDKRWIVAQGPQENTVEDFWSMIWQEKSSIIIMLTKTFEFIEVLCVQYWPLHLDKPETHGQYSVTNIYEESYAHYKVRSISLKKGKECRSLKMFHYHEWTRYSHPPNYSILQFRRRLLEEMRKVEGIRIGLPVIHCSDGGFRSGNFVAIMDMLSMAEERKRVDVYGTVRRLLEERRSFFSAHDQLTYLYDVIQDHILCGDKSVPSTNLLPVLQVSQVMMISN